MSFERFGRNTVGTEFTPQHMAINPDFLGNVRERPASLPHGHGRRDLVREQRHPVRDIRIRELLPMCGPARILRDVCLLRGRKLGPLLGTHRPPETRLLGAFC
jgi:hypothetical protein